jgi:protein-S-isoprenylcysteine O-methyltransferase Ste14
MCGVIRHPIYLSFIFFVIALILISQHWLSVIFGFPMIAFLYLSMRWEEQTNIEKFGDEYRLYMRSVPRMNLLLGVIRLQRHRKRK